MSQYTLSPSGTVNHAGVVMLSNKELLARQITASAENLSNSDTDGFKAFMLTSTESVYKNNDPTSVLKTISYVQGGEALRDLSQGTLRQTSNPYDFALNGSGYFVVQVGDQRMYTRAGRFRMDQAGNLTTMDGNPVQGDGGLINLGEYTDFSVQKNGTILAYKNGVQVVAGKVKVVGFENEQTDLKYAGYGRYIADGEEKEATNYSVLNGFAEGSNVNAVAETVKLMQITRRYEESQRITDGDDELKRKTINIKVN